MPKHLTLIATGGTIAMKRGGPNDGPAPAISGEDLLTNLPELDTFAEIQVDNFSNQPSDYITPKYWVDLHQSVTNALECADVTGVLIAHGTDTLEETAYFLDLTINSKKPLVLFGAQKNASEPDYDGPRNLLDATQVALDKASKSQGALVVMNGNINAARDVTKSHTSAMDSFQSGDAGFLGQVRKKQVVYYRAVSRGSLWSIQPKALPQVAIVPMYAGADGRFIDTAVADGASGIVVQALGLGHVNIPMLHAIQKAIRQGIVVVITSRSPNGRVMPIYGFEGGGQSLAAAGAVFGGDLPAHKARILLMLALQETSDAKKMQCYFDQFSR